MNWTPARFARGGGRFAADPRSLRLRHPAVRPRADGAGGRGAGAFAGLPGLRRRRRLDGRRRRVARKASTASPCFAIQSTGARAPRCAPASPRRRMSPTGRSRSTPTASTTTRQATELIAAIRDGERPLVVGRREGMDLPDIPWKSRFGRKFSNFWVRASGGHAVLDTQTGFRIYPLPETLELRARSNRFQFEVEVLVLARRHGIPAVEVPVRVTYSPPGGRVTHYRPWIDFWRNSAVFGRFITARVRGSDGTPPSAGGCSP